MTTGQPPAGIVVRRATEADSSLLLVWRNDSQTRLASIDQSAIHQADHEAWLRRVLADPKRILLIGALDDGASENIGTCRFDIAESGLVAEVSIALGSEYRGRGLASPLLTAAISHLTAVRPRVTTIAAKIRLTNPASLALFLRHGFVAADSHDGIATYALELSQ